MPESTFQPAVIEGLTTLVNASPKTAVSLEGKTPQGERIVINQVTAISGGESGRRAIFGIAKIGGQEVILYECGTTDFAYGEKLLKEGFVVTSLGVGCVGASTDLAQQGEPQTWISLTDIFEHRWIVDELTPHFSHALAQAT